MVKIPIPKLPKIRLRKNKKETASDAPDPEIAEILAEEDGGDTDEDRIASGLVEPGGGDSSEPKPPLMRRLLGAVKGRPGQIAAGIVILAGLGGLGTWLFLNAEDTVARRDIAIPSERIALIPDEDRQARLAAIEASRPKPEPEMADGEEGSKEGSMAEGQADTSDGEAAADGSPDAEGADAADAGEEAVDQADAGPQPDAGAGPFLIPELIEESPQGPLPKISEEGMQPWQAYSRPFNDSDPRPRIAIILTNLGLSTATTVAAINDLPGEVTLAFQPYGARLDEWIPQARMRGHEVMVSLPMEPENFPESDPGPKTLLVGLSNADNLDRMDWALSRFTGYVGVINYLGARFTTSEEAMAPILGAIRDRGLMFVDSRASSNSLATQAAETLNMIHGFNDRFIDDQPNRWSIDQRLQELERIARRVGFAVGVGQAFPVTIERVRSWATTLPTRGLAIAPISAVVDKQEVLN